MLVFNAWTEQRTNDRDLNSRSLLMSAFSSRSLRFLVCKIEIIALPLTLRPQWYNNRSTGKDWKRRWWGRGISIFWGPSTIYFAWLRNTFFTPQIDISIWELENVFCHLTSWRDIVEITPIQCEVPTQIVLFTSSPSPSFSWQIGWALCFPFISSFHICKLKETN